MAASVRSYVLSPKAANRIFARTVRASKSYYSCSAYREVRRFHMKEAYIEIVSTYDVGDDWDCTWELTHRLAALHIGRLDGKA